MTLVQAAYRALIWNGAYNCEATNQKMDKECVEFFESILKDSQVPYEGVDINNFAYSSETPFKTYGDVYDHLMLIKTMYPDE